VSSCCLGRRARSPANYSSSLSSVQTEHSDLTTTLITDHSSHTHPDTMASKSAVPSHLKPENGSDRHHGKTQSHVVCTEHAFFSISPRVASERAKMAAAAAEWQSATEHDTSEHLSNTAGDDGRILCMQQNARFRHLSLSDRHIRLGGRLNPQLLRLAEPEQRLASPHVKCYSPLRLLWLHRTLRCQSRLMLTPSHATAPPAVLRHRKTTSDVSIKSSNSRHSACVT
jgi:hypothetical protein